MIRVLSVTMKNQFIQFLPVSVRCVLQVPQMKALMKMWMKQMKVQSKTKSGNFFLEDNLTTSYVKIHVCSGHQNDGTVIIEPFEDFQGNFYVIEYRVIIS